MNAAELKIADPKRFDKEYYKWCAHALDYEWRDYTVMTASGHHPAVLLLPAAIVFSKPSVSNAI